MRFKSLVCSIAFLAALPARAGDSWISPPPDRRAWEAAATAVPPGDIVPVSNDAMPAALVLLSAKPAVPLTPAAASQYIAPVAAPTDPNLMPFLVRAVALAPCDGGFTAERNGSAAWVDFSCVGTATPAPEHRALVLYLPAAVHALFVTAATLH